MRNNVILDTLDESITNAHLPNGYILDAYVSVLEVSRRQ